MDEESVGSRGAKTLFSLITGKLVGVIITAVTFIVIARLLGPSNYGVYTLALGFSAFVGAAGHFGIGTYFNKHLAEFTAKKDMAEISSTLYGGYFILLIVGTVLSLAGILLSGFAVSHFFSKSGVHAVTLALASATVLFTMVYGAAYSALVGMGRGKYAALSMNAVYFIQLFVGVGLILMGFGVNGAIEGVLMGYAAGALIATYYVIMAASAYGRLSIKIPTYAEVKKVLNFSMPVAANNLLNSGISSFAVLLLGVYGTVYILGNYGMATKGLSLLLVFSGTMTTVLLSMFSSAIAKEKSGKDLERFYNKTLAYALLATMPAIIYIGVFAKPVVFVFITKQYSFTPLYLGLIALGTAIGLPWLYSSTFMMAKGHVRRVLKYTIISVALQLVVLLALIQKLNALGAIIAMFFVGNIASDFLLLHGIEAVFKIRYNMGLMARSYATGAIAAIVISAALLLHSMILQLALGILLLLVFYPIAMLALGVITKNMLNDIARIVKGVPLLNRLIKIIIRYIYATAKLFNAKIT